MNKVPRFLKEYATFKKREINELYDKDYSSRETIIAQEHGRIDDIIYQFKRGSITINDAMKMISIGE